MTAEPSVSSQSHQASTLPSQKLSVVESQWLFSESELLLTPSIIAGKLSPEKERENRGKGVNFILQAGIMLKLPQITLATASVFLHRFYMRHSMVDVPGRAPGYHYYSMAATCLFLATKVEENCRKMKELVIACVRVAQKDPNKLVDEQDSEYWRWRDNILHSEDVLLETLCFDLNLEAPYKILFELLLQLHHENHKRLRNAAWAFVNDSCLTMLCLLFPCRIIAASAVYAAAKHTGVNFLDDRAGRPWWEAAGVDIIEVRKACNYMADMYEGVPAKSGGDGMSYEHTPEHLDIWDDRTRDLTQRGDEGQSQNGSAEGDGQDPMNRPRGEGKDQNLHPNGSLTSTISTRLNGNKENVHSSPEGPVTNENTGINAAAERNMTDDQVAQPGIILGSQALNGVATPIEKTQDDLDAPSAERLAGGGLVSPKIDEVSEEGEVEP